MRKYTRWDHGAVAEMYCARPSFVRMAAKKPVRYMTSTMTASAASTKAHSRICFVFSFIGTFRPFV